MYGCIACKPNSLELVIGCNHDVYIGIVLVGIGSRLVHTPISKWLCVGWKYPSNCYFGTKDGRLLHGLIPNAI